jgi:SIT4-associating protein SAP185/190
MFWRFGGYANISTIDSILDKPDVTVEELLEESDLIQELKQQNSKLIEFLRDDNVLERLLQYVVASKGSELEPSPDGDEKDAGGGGGALGWLGSKRRPRSKSVGKDEDEESKEEKQRMKYAYVACEILSSDVWSLAEALLENQDNLRRFWGYLKQEEPLDGVQAGYFTKVNESLLDKKVEEMLDFFKTVDDVIPDMLRHVDCPCVMDLLLKIISLERQEGGQGIVDVSLTSDAEGALLTHRSGCNRKTSYPSCSPDYPQNTLHQRKHRPAIFSKPSLRYQRMPQHKIKTSSDPTSLQDNWCPKNASGPLSAKC